MEIQNRKKKKIIVSETDFIIDKIMQQTIKIKSHVKMLTYICTFK